MSFGNWKWDGNGAGAVWEGLFVINIVIPSTLQTKKSNHFFFLFFFLFSSKQRYVRGASPDLIFVDEANYVDPRLWPDALSPIFANATCSVQIFTSAGTTGDLAVELEKKCREDPDIFSMRSVEMAHICKDCLASGSTLKAMQCKHKMFLLPPWKDASKAEAMESMMEENMEVFMREYRGVATSNDFQRFNEELLKNLFSGSDFIFRPVERNPRLFVTCDPSGGLGDMALAAGVLIDGKTMVVSCFFFLLFFKTNQTKLLFYSTTNTNY